MASHKDNIALKEFREKCKRISASTLINVLETKEQQLARITVMKKDFKKFVGYYFAHYGESETPDFHVKLARKVRRNKKYKGWLKWARGHAKSVVAIVLLPIWLWINGEIDFLLVVGQNEDKAKMLLSDLQAEFESNQRLINDFGAQKVNGTWEKGFFVTASGFIAKAIGLGQDPRGIRVGPRRPNMIVGDDWETRESVKNPKRQDEYAEWLLRAVIPTMDDKSRRVLLAQNDFAPRMIFTKIVEENEAWDIDRVDAYDPVTYMPTWKEKYPRWFFKELEEELGTLRVLAEYNNQPFVEGKLFLDEYIQWKRLPQLRQFTAITGRWDVAYGGTKTSDYNAIRVWGLYEGNKYLIDCFVKQSTIKEALRWIADFQNRLNQNVSVLFKFEAQFWNEAIHRDIEEIETELKLRLNLIKADRPTKKKYDRIIEMLPDYQNGRVYYNEKLKSHNDTHVGLAQLKGIEPGYKTNDDAPDADKEAFDDLDKVQSSRSTKYRTRKAESRKF